MDLVLSLIKFKKYNMKEKNNLMVYLILLVALLSVVNLFAVFIAPASNAEVQLLNITPYSLRVILPCFLR